MQLLYLFGFSFFFTVLPIQEERAARNVRKKLLVSAFNLHSKVFLILRILIIKLPAKWELAKVPATGLSQNIDGQIKSQKTNSLSCEKGPSKGHEGSWLPKVV